MGNDESRGRRAVFLDRDGVINRNVLNPATGDFESPLSVEDFELEPGVPDALHQLQGSGFLLFLVSNQPNFAKGKSSLRALADIHETLVAMLAGSGISFASYSYCFHHPDGIVEGYSGKCVCRKPSPYFLLTAAADFSLDLSRCWMVGDRCSDIECGRRAGTKTIFIGDGRCAGSEAGIRPDGMAPDLPSAVGLILNHAMANRSAAVSMR